MYVKITSTVGAQFKSTNLFVNSYLIFHSENEVKSENWPVDLNKPTRTLLVTGAIWIARKSFRPRGIFKNSYFIRIGLGIYIYKGSIFSEYNIIRRKTRKNNVNSTVVWTSFHDFSNWYRIYGYFNLHYCYTSFLFMQIIAF